MALARNWFDAHQAWGLAFGPCDQVFKTCTGHSNDDTSPCRGHHLQEHAWDRYVAVAGWAQARGQAIHSPVLRVLRVGRADGHVAFGAGAPAMAEVLPLNVGLPVNVLQAVTQMQRCGYAAVLRSSAVDNGNER